ncbi:MAG: hypothetical protein M1818_003347 [Claussenomyces sp. TS43310]|nr:MAG: hypothetical protein M1818_003347 [Claussenomyces sp. TS43310]
MQFNLHLLVAAGFMLVFANAASIPKGSVSPKEGVPVPQVGEAFENGYASEDTVNGASGY